MSNPAMVTQCISFLPKTMWYKDIAKIRSKFDSLISVAGGLEYDDVRKAYFNGADIAILNVLASNDPNVGLRENANFRQLIPVILDEVGH